MNILALDFGTATGYCLGNGLEILDAGTWQLASKKEIPEWRRLRWDRKKDPRISRLWELLWKRISHPDWVVFEDVEFSSYTKQNQLWSSFRAVAWLRFPMARFECVPVGTLKKFATGSGNATKEMMRAALKRHTDYGSAAFGRDDNAVDAIWVWLWAKQNLGRIGHH